VLCSPAEPKGEYHSPVSESTTHNGGGLKKVLEGLVKEDNSQKEENQKKNREEVIAKYIFHSYTKIHSIIDDDKRIYNCIYY
jgi:hypothetical protein